MGAEIRKDEYQIDGKDELLTQLDEAQEEIKRLRIWAQESQDKYKQQLEITEKLRNKIRQLKTERGPEGNWIKL